MDEPKPRHVFDRDREWQGLTAFASVQREGATLGVVSGRRRQGKSYLLEPLAERLGGLYFPAVEATEAESLRMLSDALLRHSGRPAAVQFRSWDDAVPYLFSQFQDRPLPLIIDEFPFLVKVSPSLPSIIQRELGPGGSGRHSYARLLLC